MERWRDVVGYEGLYQVSDLGRVRSVDRVVPHARSGTLKLKGKILRTVPSGQCGHFMLAMCKDGVQRSVWVHRIVLEAWVGPCPKDCECLHGPNGTVDNSVSNLRWGTHTENLFDRRRDGTHGGKAVVRSDGEIFVNMNVAAEVSGCHISNIWSCCNGRRKTTGGFGWRYRDGRSN